MAEHWDRSFQLSRSALADRDYDRIQRVRHDAPNRVLDQLHLRTLILGAPANVRPILTMLWLGYTQVEIAAELSVKPSVIGQRLFQWRKDKLIPMVQSGRLVLPGDFALVRDYALARFAPPHLRPYPPPRRLVYGRDFSWEDLFDEEAGR